MSRQTAMEQKRTQEFVALCRRHTLALSQAQNALESGHPKIADEVLKKASAIQIQIAQNCRGGQCGALLNERTSLSRKLHAALEKHQSSEARQLAGDLAALDKLIEAS